MNFLGDLFIFTRTPIESIQDVSASLIAICLVICPNYQYLNWNLSPLWIRGEDCTELHSDSFTSRVHNFI
jgi:hypothetical protein